MSLALLAWLVMTTASPGEFVFWPEPSVSSDDLVMFPPVDVVTANIETCQQRVEYLKALSVHSVYWRDENVQMLEDARWLLEIWKTLQEAQESPHGPRWQMQSLEALRYGLGYEAYYAGRMPSPLPGLNKTGPSIY